MKQTINLQLESLATMTRFNTDISVSSDKAAQTRTIDFYHNFKSTPVNIPVKSISLDDLLDTYNQDGEFKELFKQANIEIANEFYKDENSLRKLRLLKGLTQNELAEALNTSQAQIAKIESGKNEVLSGTVLKMSKFFDLPRGQMFEILTGEFNEA